MNQSEKKAFLREEVHKLITKHLVDKGYIDSLDCTAFVYQFMTEEIAKAFIGLDNFRKQNPDIIKDIDMSICLGHDIGGILREDKMFLPRALSYTEFFKFEL
jgi:hypothetical protein